MNLLSLLGFLVIGVLGWVYVFQERMVYFPAAVLDATPAEAGLSYEDVALTAADGTALHGWFVPADGAARGAVLFCHGNAGNIAGRLDTLGLLHGLGFHVLLFDYRGYGRSEGQPSERGTYRDAEAAWKHLVEARGVAPECVVVHGRSLGGGVAAWLAARRNPGALILESTFTSMREMGKRAYPFLPGFLARIRYDTLDALDEVACPLLVAHGAGDELVPVEFGRRLYEAYDGPKRFLPLRGGHNDGYLVTGGAYVQAVDDFLREVAGL